MFWGQAVDCGRVLCFTDHLDFFRSEGDDWERTRMLIFLVRYWMAGKNQKKQTRYLQNAAYLRLKNLQIGYTLPASLTKLKRDCQS